MQSMTNGNVAGDKVVLLTTFRSLYESRSVVRAADSLAVTQSAVSKHLQKLRFWFDDELFVRTSEGMEPTPKAINLMTKVDEVLQSMDALESEGLFDPAQLNSRFVIATTDEISLQLLAPLLEKLEEFAPNLQLAIVPLTEDYSIRKVETAEVDLVISVNWHAPEQLLQKRIYEDNFVCLMSDKHTLAHSKLTLDTYAGASHIMVAPLGRPKSLIDDVLLSEGYSRAIKASTASFNAVNEQLLGDKYIATLPSRVAKVLESRENVVIKPLPVKLNSFTYYLFWHRRYDRENLNQWMRGLIVDCLK